MPPWKSRLRRGQQQPPGGVSDGCGKERLSMPIWIRLLLPACILVLASTFAHAAIEIARDGKSPYVIVIADDAGVVPNYAARELQELLRQVTGAQLPIVSESALAGGDAPKILVGLTRLTRQLVPGPRAASLDADGIVMKTVGDDIVLTGPPPRGILYAVNTFLEKAIGVRWWTST